VTASTEDESYNNKTDATTFTADEIVITIGI
jgi:hypothetical protein